LNGYLRRKSQRRKREKGVGIKILHGNCLDRLKDLEDQSINTYITSPPYWGLRDYGTAEWEGGDSECDHLGPPLTVRHGFNERYFDKKSKTGNKQDALREIFKNQCGKCGAVRKDSQLGLEETPEAFVENLVEVFREVKRVLRDDGTVWLNLGDTYSATRWSNTPSTTGVSQSHSDIVLQKKTKLPDKNLVGIPWRVAFALQADGWYLRQDIIWHKPNPMPESVTDRCTKSHEYIFLLSKNKKYYYDHEAIKEDCIGKDERQWADTYDKVGSAVQGDTNAGIKRTKRYSKDGTFKRNKRSVWTVTTKPFKGAHFATFPMDLIEPCVLAGCPVGGAVLDPFGGSGTTAQVANAHNRDAVLIELNEEYIEIAKKRLAPGGDLFTEIEVL